MAAFWWLELEWERTRDPEIADELIAMFHDLPDDIATADALTAEIAEGIDEANQWEEEAGRLADMYEQGQQQVSFHKEAHDRILDRLEALETENAYLKTLTLDDGDD